MCQYALKTECKFLVDTTKDVAVLAERLSEMVKNTCFYCRNKEFEVFWK